MRRAGPALPILIAVLFAGMLAGGRRAGAQNSTANEYIVICGGPSLIEWEKLKKVPHDHWWANFVRASRIRLGELRERHGENALVTWMVYKPGYVRRGARQEKRDLLPDIRSVQSKYNLNLVYFKNRRELIDYLNGGTSRHPRADWKIADLEYFGHSNRACFMFDYSNEIDSGSKVWLHEKELGEINRGIFAPGAFVKSWGCHTGESMSSLWKRALGLPMIGAIGTTDYSGSDDPGWHPKLGSGNGRWTR
jgi:hypothetical protein